MSKTKIYAVKKGKKTGLFYTWSECKDAVNGYSGAEYKSFETKEDAEKYLFAVNNEVNTGQDNTIIPSSSGIIAYVDGSYSQTIGKYSYGCILILPNKEIIREAKSGSDSELIKYKNVTGEILGVMYAIEWCDKNNYSEIEICYDYSGIEKWATGEWTANNAFTQKYAAFIQDKRKTIAISFKKVTAHTGNKYNEEADRLAKSSLTSENQQTKIKKGEFWFVVEDILWSDLKVVLELLDEEFENRNIEKKEKEISYGKSFFIKLDAKDSITLNYYDNTNKLMIQGKPKELFSTVLSYVTELVDIDDIPNIYNNAYQINIDKETVRNEFEFYLPNSYNKLPEKISKTLHQAVYNLKLNGDMFDGTFLAQPVIRAIDGHLRMILLNLEIVPDYKYINKNGYDMFESMNSRYHLRLNRCGKATNEQIKYIGNCYTFFHNNRNQLSHWDDPTSPIDTTKLLNVDAAHDLIKRTLKLIDDYYINK